jgi:hypothetical protein
MRSFLRNCNKDINLKLSELMSVGAFKIPEDKSIIFFVAVHRY